MAPPTQRHPPLARRVPARSSPTRRRQALCAALAVLGGGLTACSTPLPAIRWVRLPAEAADPMPPPQPAPGTGSAVWQWMAPLGLPGHLDRNVLWVPQGSAGLQALGDARWAEPLRDAVPRLLRADLSHALGRPLWVAPLPPGLKPTHQLRIEIGALDVTADGRGVALQARWSVADPAGASAPRWADTAFVIAAAGAGAGADVDAWVAAHRQALQQLALRIAQWVVATGRA